MKEIILYGAGQRGMKIAEVLHENNIDIAGFCDSNKKGSILINFEMEKELKPVWSLDEIDGSKYVFVVTIADCEQRAEVEDKLKNNGIRVLSVEDVLCNKGEMVKENREIIANYHQKRMDSYFTEAENIDAVNIFWSQESLFINYFKRLNTERIVELACGRGRHVPHYINDAKEIILVDILQKNIDFCRCRFKDED